MKNSRRAHYHLRFQVLPGPAAKSDAVALASFCKLHDIEEVALFFAAEEWNDGLFSKANEDRWFNAVKAAKDVLDRHGISVSLNPWMTSLHCARGRHFPSDRKFTPMVSPKGEVSKACASFDDPQFRKYLCNLYARFARLGFRVMWVEDDFRFHNHGPLSWGGGFEQPVLNRFSKKIGRKVGREEVVKAFLKPGKPHPWRSIWCETWRDIHLEVARELAQAVKEAMPGETRIGLMTSGPDNHSVEGRHWNELFEAFSINGKVAHRPHYGPYNDALGQNKPYSIMMLDVQRQFRPPSVEVAPEVENFPFTAWSKSDVQTWSEMAFCQFFGSDALLLDVFPFSGNRAQEEAGIGRMLKHSRPALDWITDRFTPAWTTSGVGLPWRHDAAERQTLLPGASMFSLNSFPMNPGYFLLNYGIAVSTKTSGVNAIFGQTASIFDNDEIRAFLSCGLLLDGEAAKILQDRGFGREIGCKVQAVVDREDERYALEQVAAGILGLRKGFYMNANLMSQIMKIEPSKGAAEWTTIIRPDSTRFGAGITAFSNRLGGRVVVWATPNPAQLPANYQRQILAQSAVRFAAGQAWHEGASVRGGPYLQPVLFTCGSSRKLVISNGCPDSAIPQAEGPLLKQRPDRAFVLAPLAKPQKVAVTAISSHGSQTWQLKQAIPSHGFAVLEWD